MAHQKSLIPIARIRRTQGRDGAVRIQIEFQDERLFEAGREVSLTLEGQTMDTTFESVRQQHGRWVAKLRSIDSISEAEQWVGATIRVPRDHLPLPEDGSYFSFDLEGCAVYARGEPIGVVTHLFDYGSAALLAVDRNGSEVLIPFAKAYLKSVDTAAKTIEVDLPEGLLEL